MSSGIPEDARLEIKYVARETEIHRLKLWLKLHPARFWSPYPSRRVNNVYLDNFDTFAFSENISGASARNKVRYRWYGEHDYPDTGTLEIKRKRNYFGWKLKFPLKESPYDSGASWRDIIASLTRQVGPQGKIWLQANPCPILLNRYWREYYVTQDNKFRVTIDSKQVVFDQRYLPHPNIVRRANNPSTLVLEFKFARGDNSLANQIMQEIPLRVSKNSKYIQGLLSIANF